MSELLSLPVVLVTKLFSRSGESWRDEPTRGQSSEEASGYSRQERP